jgi:CRISPR-associated protein Cas1
MTLINDKPSLYIIARRGDQLEKYGKTLRIRDAESGEIRQKVPILAIKDIVILGNIHLETGVFELIAEAPTPVHFLSVGGKYKASLVFDPGKNLFLRQAQFELTQHTARRVAFMSAVVLAKVRNSNKLLQRLRASGRVSLPELTGLDAEQIRGAEGAAARQYFSYWENPDVLKSNAFKWYGRHRRPPTDPVNSLLSLCSSLLHSHVHSFCNLNGLDPYVGYLHEAHYGRPSLVCDLVEEFRAPIIEQFVLRAVNRAEFVLEDFEEELGGAYKLSRSGFEKFFPKWSEHLAKLPVIVDGSAEPTTWTRLCERQVRRFVQYLMGDRERYEPFIW